MMVLCTLSTVVKDAGGFWFILKRCDGRWMGHWVQALWLDGTGEIAEGPRGIFLETGTVHWGHLNPNNPRAAAGAAV